MERPRRAEQGAASELQHQPLPAPPTPLRPHWHGSTPKYGADEVRLVSHHEARCKPVYLHRQLEAKGYKADSDGARGGRRKEGLTSQRHGTSLIWHPR